MDSIPPGRLLALVRPGNDLVLRRIRNLKRCVQACGCNITPRDMLAIWSRLHFKRGQALPKGNPFSLFFGTPFLRTPCFLFFGFFLALQRLARLKCNLEPNCKRISGSLCCSHTPARSVLGFESFAGRGRFLRCRSALKSMAFCCSPFRGSSTIIEFAILEAVLGLLGQRAGAFLLRQVRGILAWKPHKAVLFVDDLLCALVRDSAPEMFALVVLFFCAIAAPISWKKAQFQDSLIWCGWEINFAAGQRDAADPRGCGEKELSELGKYCTSCRAVT